MELNNQVNSGIVKGDIVDGGLNTTTREERLAAEKQPGQLGKEDFLQLLVTSLQHQDPLEPTGNTEFIGQMAQFTSLENSKNMVDSIDKLSTGLNSLIEKQTVASDNFSSASATSMLGKNVRIETKELDYKGSKLEMQLHVDNGKEGVVSIVDEEGNVVNVLEVEGTGSTQSFFWDGQKAQGGYAEFGKYTAEVTTRDGTRDIGYVFIEDKVTGISYESGGTKLNVGNQSYDIKDVVHVSEG